MQGLTLFTICNTNVWAGQIQICIACVQPSSATTKNLLNMCSIWALLDTLNTNCKQIHSLHLVCLDVLIEQTHQNPQCNLEATQRRPIIGPSFCAVAKQLPRVNLQVCEYYLELCSALSNFHFHIHRSQVYPDTF